MNENTSVNLNEFKKVVARYNAEFAYNIMYDFITPDGEEGQDFIDNFDAFSPEEMETFTVSAVYVEIQAVWYSVKFSNLDDIENTIAIVECYDDYMNGYISEEMWQDIFEHFEHYEILSVGTH